MQHFFNFQKAIEKEDIFIEKNITFFRKTRDFHTSSTSVMIDYKYAVHH